LLYPLKNPTLGPLVEERDNALGLQIGLWFTEVELCGVVPKAAWH
jgi:hypothetical protein